MGKNQKKKLSPEKLWKLVIKTIFAVSSLLLGIAEFIKAFK